MGLSSHALIADGYRGALVSPGGQVGWLCVPAWDSTPVCAALAGGRSAYAVTPAGRCVWSGHYEPGTLIWRSRWVSSDAVVECRDALAYPGEPDTVRVLRRIEARTGEAVVDVDLELTALGGVAATRVHQLADGDWLIQAGAQQARWSGCGPSDAVHLGGTGALRARLRIPPGGRRDLVLQVGKQLDRIAPDHAWTQTALAWRSAVPEFGERATERDAAHCYAVLRGLGTAGQGLVAAARPDSSSLGLPHVVLRDQIYAGLAAGVESAYPLLDEMVAFTTARVLEHGDRLAPAYGVDGRPLPDAMTGGFCLDVYGDALQLYAVAAFHDHLQPDDQRAVETVLEVIQRRWSEPDGGMWGASPAWWTHSRLACVAGLRAIALWDMGVEPEWISGLAETILTETTRRCSGPDQVWRACPSQIGVDPALLLPLSRGAVSPFDLHRVATVRAVQSRLVRDGWVYRHRDDRSHDERAHAKVGWVSPLCGFALCLAHLESGETEQATSCYDRQRGASGLPELFAEDYDAQRHELHGAYPRTIVHAVQLECAQRLTQGSRCATAP